MNLDDEKLFDFFVKTFMWDIKQLQGGGNDLRGLVYVNTHKEAEETCRQLTEKFVLFYSITEV